MKNIKIERVEEYNLLPTQISQIQSLLQKAFPSYPKGRHYFNQLPNFRYLAWHDGKLVGQMGVDFRVISFEGQTHRIFGVVDLCVAEGFQSQKIGSELLGSLETLALQSDIDFILLMAQRFDVYRSNGFELVENSCKWLMIHKHQSFGILHRKLENCLMVKPLTNRKWTSETVDFLGPLF